MEVPAISTYVISDIHGEYDKFMELLDKINLNETVLFLLMVSDVEKERTQARLEKIFLSSSMVRFTIIIIQSIMIS